MDYPNGKPEDMQLVTDPTGMKRRPAARPRKWEAHMKYLMENPNLWGILGDDCLPNLVTRIRKGLYPDLNGEHWEAMFQNERTDRRGEVWARYIGPAIEEDEEDPVW